MSKVHKRIPFAERFWSKVDIRGPDECWEWQAGKANGYGVIRRGDDGGLVYAHRAAYELNYGFIPEGKQVNHHCDNRLCCNPVHLYAGTSKDNAQDCLRRNRKYSVKGEHNGRAKLTEDKVIAILQDTRLQREIAVDFGVGPGLISDIKCGRRWGHVLI